MERSVFLTLSLWLISCTTAPPAPEPARFAITSDPSDATIYLEWRRPPHSPHYTSGLSPLRIGTTLPTGEFSYAVARAGFRTAVGNINSIEPGNTGALHIQLEPVTATRQGEYIAFSLKSAQRHLELVGTRTTVADLGGIQKVDGFVLEPGTGDVIVVGRRAKERPSLHLDDLVVALRARLLRNEWPAVSIDLVDSKVESTELRQIVRFEAGIENTRFGFDLFDADYRLKLIGLGYLESGVPGFPTYWGLRSQRLRNREKGAWSRARFWFYPVVSRVLVRDGVGVVEDLTVKVFTEQMDGAHADTGVIDWDTEAAIFASAVNDLFAELARHHESIARLVGLEELVALTRALEELGAGQDELDYWLRVYTPETVACPEFVELVRRSDGRHSMSGGVQTTAIALRLTSGDVTALRDAVLLTKPFPDSISWTFSVGQWIIPTSSGAIDASGLSRVYAEALYFARHGRWELALQTLDTLESYAPGLPEVAEMRAKVEAASRM